MPHHKASNCIASNALQVCREAVVRVAHERAHALERGTAVGANYRSTDAGSSGKKKSRHSSRVRRLELYNDGGDSGRAELKSLLG